MAVYHGKLLDGRCMTAGAAKLVFDYTFILPPGFYFTSVAFGRKTVLKRKKDSFQVNEVSLVSHYFVLFRLM